MEICGTSSHKYFWTRAGTLFEPELRGLNGICPAIRTKIRWHGRRAEILRALLGHAMGADRTVAMASQSMPNAKLGKVSKNQER